MLTLYDKLVTILLKTLIRNYKKTAHNIINLKWNYLIILDSCRCDIFKHIYKLFFDKVVSFRCITSSASSTIDYIKIVLGSNTQEISKDIIFVNSNPMIDKILGDKIRKMFFKYIPTWKYYWDPKLETVKPEDVFYVTLKVFLKYPTKKMIIWFLQPHYPYIDRRFSYINSLAKDFMNRFARSKVTISNTKVLFDIFGMLLKKRYLCAGIPKEICEYMHKYKREVIGAYTANLLIVLKYVKLLSEVLPGTIIISSDHGEAFGEPIELGPLRISVYGHPSKIRIKPLVEVPCLIIKNNIDILISLKKALRYLKGVLFKKQCSLVV